MAPIITEKLRNRLHTRLTVGRLALLAVSVFFAIVSLVALGSGFGFIALPFEMHILAKELPVIFRLHMVASAVALLLAPVVLAVRNRANLHRPLGRILGVSVVMGGLTAIPVALLSHSAIWARAGFFVQGIVWLVLLGFAIMAIRQRNVARHAFLMMAMVAVTSGAVWFRLITGTAISLQLPFTLYYALASWIAWLVPLALVWLFRDRLLARLLTPKPHTARRSSAGPIPAISIFRQTS